jgi:AcrR family transcriptional regulator
MTDFGEAKSALHGESNGPNGSRRHRKKQRTRREIYEAAMELFAEGGFDEVTLTQICDAADISRGTFFLHFPSKAALLYEFERRVVEDFVASSAEQPESAGDEIRALTEYIAEQRVASARIMRAMVREFLLSPEAIAAAPKHSDSLLALVESIITRGQKTGEFTRVVAPKLAAAAYLSTAAAIIRLRLAGEGGIPVNEECRQLLQLTFSGLAPSGDSQSQLRPRSPQL